MSVPMNHRPSTARLAAWLAAKLGLVYLVARVVGRGIGNGVDDVDEEVGAIGSVFPSDERLDVLEDSDLPNVCRMCETGEERPRIPGTFLCPTCAAETWGLTEARRVARESRANNWEGAT